jgi:hypothetical protein
MPALDVSKATFMTPRVVKVALLTLGGRRGAPDCSKATFTQPRGMKVAMLQLGGEPR